MQTSTYPRHCNRRIAEKEELIETLCNGLGEEYENQKQYDTGITIAKMRPRTQARIVLTGMSGSSVLATADRTSG